MPIAEAHFLARYRLFWLVCYRSYTRLKCCFTQWRTQKIQWRGSTQFLPLPPLPPSILPSLAPQLNQLGPGGALAENEFGAL